MSTPPTVVHYSPPTLDIPRQSETTTVSLIKYNEKEASDISLLALLLQPFQASFYPLVDWNQLTHEEYELAFEKKLEKHKAYQPARCFCCWL